MTRSTEVKPELIKGVFQCNLCRAVIPNIDQMNQFTLPKFCLNRTCKNSNAFKLINEMSTFENWQKLMVQENIA